MADFNTRGYIGDLDLIDCNTTIQNMLKTDDGFCKNEAIKVLNELIKKHPHCIRYQQDLKEIKQL